MKETGGMNVCLRILEFNSKGVDKLVVFNDLLYCHSCSKVIRVFDQYNNCVQYLQGYEYNVDELIVYNNTLYANHYGDLRIFDTNGIKTIRHHTDTCSVLFIYNDLLYVSSWDGTTSIWNKENICIKTLQNPGVVIQYSVEYNKLLYFANENNINIWDKTDNCVQILTGHSKNITCLAVYNNFLYSSSYDRTVRKWDLKGNCVSIIKTFDIILIMKVYSGLLYMVSFDDNIYTYDISDRCIKISKSYISNICGSVVYNNYIYFWNRLGKSIDVRGVYYSYHYTSLPKFQKKKLKNWRSSWRICSIHKDIAFLIERELLH